MIPDELQPEFVLRAYCAGLFPMADHVGRINWYSPEPRAIIPLPDFKTARSLRQRIRRGDYETHINRRFDDVIRCCADRPAGTWISEALIETYCQLNRLGFAHSVETYYGPILAGGLYGVSLGGAFFGESMFTCHTDASKLALVALVEHMRARAMILLDVQFLTPHLARFGAREITRLEYLTRLHQALQLDVTFVD